MTATIIKKKTALDILTDAQEVLRTTKWTCHSPYGHNELNCIESALCVAAGRKQEDWPATSTFEKPHMAAFEALKAAIYAERGGLGEMSPWRWNDGGYCTSGQQAIDMLETAKGYLP
jgi:hypothetical protein